MITVGKAIRSALPIIAKHRLIDLDFVSSCIYLIDPIVIN